MKSIFLVLLAWCFVFSCITRGVLSLDDEALKTAEPTNDGPDSSSSSSTSSLDEIAKESPGLFIMRADRYIDISNPIVRQTTQFMITNAADKSFSTFYFGLPHDQANSLAIIRVSELLPPDPSSNDQNSNQEKPFLHKPLPVFGPSSPQFIDSESYVFWRVDFDQELKPTETINIVVSLAMTHRLIPAPRTIKQGQDQQFLYHDSHFIFSPYHIKSQVTRVKLPTTQAKSYSRLEPTAKKGDVITYGPYEDTPPFSTSPATVHHTNNSPFITITQLQRDFEVSHWGNLAVEETYWIEHSGPVLEGPFSRFDYQRFGMPGSVTVLTQRLPEGVDTREGLIYYRDEIGNISTSHLSKFPDGSTKLEILPRFLLVGGWKTTYYMGYNLDLSKYLSVSASGTYVLNVTFAPQQAGLLVDSYTIRVILPEGSSDIQLHSPIQEKTQYKESHYTYLDTTGRPVLVCTFNNIVEEHSGEYFQVTYNFNQLSMLQEPLLLIFSFFVLFLAAIIFVRIDLSIYPSQSAAS